MNSSGLGAVRVSDRVQQARQRLDEARHKISKQHADGTPGIQLCAALAGMMDDVVLGFFESVLFDLGEQAADLEDHIVLVAHGGYGRRDVAPYSDVDLMLLHTPAVRDRVPLIARRMVEDISDVGLDLGFSVRTPRQSCQLAWQDPVIFTSLAESRRLAGEERLFAKFQQQFFRAAQRRSRMLIGRIEEARRQERRKYGETVYLLEPNIKRSRGALRDLHLLRWIGFARYGEANLENLRNRGVLANDDYQRLRSAQEFLLRLRNELHFHAGTSQDVLARSEQLRIADRFGYQGSDAVLPVEQFMQEYFRHTSEVRTVGAHFVASARPRSAVLQSMSVLASHQMEGDFRVGPVHISATRRGMQKLPGDLAEVLRLMDLSNLCDKRIAHDTWQAIRDAMMAQADLQVTPEAAERFLSLLSQPPRLGNLLRRLHELRVLEKLVPGFQQARGLLQFNEYHKYTVDEHCVRAVECVTEFAADTGPLGTAYKSIPQKRTLHLALLIHDLGKGQLEDHSEVGRRIAQEVAGHLNLSGDETDALVFLVHRHLMLSHLAFRRDTGDESVVVQAAVEVGSPELLRMLYVLTCADYAAVGPGVLNQWKIEVLTSLYRRMMNYLGGDTAVTHSAQQLADRQAAIREAIRSKESADWYEQQIQALPPAYLSGTSAQQMAEDLQRLRPLLPDRAIAWGRYLPGQHVSEYSIGAHEQLTPGIFYKLTGALTGQGLQILAAEIHSLAGSLVLDRFYVQDPDYDGEPPEDRIVRVTSALTKSLMDGSDRVPTFRRTWHQRRVESAAKLTPLPSRVLFDNTSSLQHTIIDVFAHDRSGLLYRISRTLFEVGLSVHIAKIGTHLDQVVDVFYVTNYAGHKLQDNRRLAEIRQRLLAAIEVE